MNGIKKSELKTRLFKTAKNPVFDAILAPMLADKRIVLQDETVCLAGHGVSFTPRQEEFRRKIADIYRAAAFVTPSVEELERGFPEAKKNEIPRIVTGMIQLGELIEIRTGEEKAAVFHAENIDKAEKILVGMLREKGQVRLFEFREAIGSTRKFATPILIYFDRRGLTEFDGEFRRLRD